MIASLSACDLHQPDFVTASTIPKIVKRAQTEVASEPEVLVEFFKGLSSPVTRIGLEAGPLSQWLHASLTRAGFERFFWRRDTLRRRFQTNPTLPLRAKLEVWRNPCVLSKIWRRPDPRGRGAA